MSTRHQALALALVAAAVPLWSLSGSMAYRGHADHRDVDAVLASDPALAGTPADSCATCHRSGDVADRRAPGGVRSENHCDYCHLEREEVVFFGAVKPPAESPRP